MALITVVLPRQRPRAMRRTGLDGPRGLPRRRSPRQPLSGCRGELPPVTRQHAPTPAAAAPAVRPAARRPLSSAAAASPPWCPGECRLRSFASTPRHKLQPRQPQGPQRYRSYQRVTAASKVVVDPDDPRSLIARHLTPDPAATLLTRHPTRCRGPRPTALSVQPVSGCIRSPKPVSHTIFSYGRPRPKSPFCSTLSPLCFQTGKKLCPSVGLQALTQPPAFTH